MKGVPKFKSRSRDLGHAPFVLVQHYVIFHLLDISVKFRNDNFICCQDICENAHNWLWQEMLPKSVFLGINGGGGRFTLKQNNNLGIYLPPKHILLCIERQATFYRLLCRRSQGTKKSTRCGNFTHTPTLHHSYRC